MLRRLGLTIQAAPSPPAVVAPLAIKDKVRFYQLDRLIQSGYGNLPQDKIPDEVMLAVEENLPIPVQGPDKDVRFASPVFEAGGRKPKKPPRTMTPEKIERRRYLAKQRYDFRFPGRRKETKNEVRLSEYASSDRPDGVG
jgi:hypothetical protein